MYIGTKPITRTEGKGERRMGHSRAIDAFPQINSPDENVAGACARTHIMCTRNRIGRSSNIIHDNVVGRGTCHPRWSEYLISPSTSVSTCFFRVLYTPKRTFPERFTSKSNWTRTSNESFRKHLSSRASRPARRLLLPDAFTNRTLTDVRERRKSSFCSFDNSVKLKIRIDRPINYSRQRGPNLGVVYIITSENNL